MPEIFGLSGMELRQRVGALSQVVRVDSFIEAEGQARGARRLRVVNGGGLEIELHPDRALDIGQVTFAGVPIAWVSSVGPVGPEQYEADGSGWLRTFSGGLLATCGLDTFGPPTTEPSRSFGLHGRIGTQRASITSIEANDQEVAVEAVVRQSSVFGENFELRRRVSSPTGSGYLSVRDRVTNASFEPQPHMVLYHFNLGWPLIDAHTTIRVPSESTIERETGRGKLDDWMRAGPPHAGYRERVFLHTLSPSPAATVVVENPERGLAVSLTVNSNQLPFIHQWRMTGQSNYVMGIEPANSPRGSGRSSADVTPIPILAAGESAEYEMKIGVTVEPGTRPR